MRTAIGAVSHAHRPRRSIDGVPWPTLALVVVGETGQKILRALVAGERDGQVLAAMKHVRVRASREEIAKSPQGNWRTEQFVLKQALALFDFVGIQLAERDAAIEAQLPRLQAHDGVPANDKNRSRARNVPNSTCVN
ncbi:MAG: hypothetical protein ABI411_19195 [Tahibacter sp.]